MCYFTPVTNATWLPQLLMLPAISATNATPVANATSATNATPVDNASNVPQLLMLLRYPSY